MSRSISKFLSLVLRHDPARIGIVLDDAGWTDVGELIAAAAKHGRVLTRDELFAIVASSDKQRFALSEDKTRIRANQGHSVDVDLQLPPATPPAVLYHGTVEPFLAGIRAKGLVRGERHHVHLSPDIATATKVGERRGVPVILAVRAGDMAAAGHVFYRSDNGVWLVDRVPAEFVDFPAPTAAADRRNDVARGARAGIAKQTLAAIEAGAYTNAVGDAVPLRDAIEAAKGGTRLHEAGAKPTARRAGPTRVTVTTESTIEALRRLDRHTGAGGGHLACLNFASAKNPGGGFLGGAQAQEESLARSSALYPCLLTQRAHYDRNRAHGSALYLDLAIWSPHVPVFRDDRGGWLERPVLASVVTCAAPNAGALRQQDRFDAAAIEATLRRRAALVFAVAAEHGVERFVLGAWGAGVFGNDPALVADAFGVLLEGDYRDVFAEVVFAVMGQPSANHTAFAARFPG